MDDDFRNSLAVDLKPLKTLNDVEQQSLYREYVDAQRKHFEAYINFLNSELCVLKHYGIVSDFTRFLARIKSVESSIKNDKTKALNDIFGLEIDSATFGEVAFVTTLFSDTMEKTKETVHNKDNGYVAHHYSGYPKAGNIVLKLEEILDTTYKDTELFDDYMKNLPDNLKEEFSEQKKTKLKEYFKEFSDSLNMYVSVIKSVVNGEKLKSLKRDLKKEEQEYYKSEKLKNGQMENDFIPIIEGQFKTIQTAIEANIGSAKHGDYKGEDISKIQEEYDKNRGLPLSRLPVMYKSNLETDENGRPIPPKILSSDETAKALYPSLIVKKKGEIGREGEIK